MQTYCKVLVVPLPRQDRRRANLRAEALDDWALRIPAKRMRVKGVGAIQQQPRNAQDLLRRRRAVPSEIAQKFAGQGEPRC